MKVLRGRQKIGTVNGANVILDFTELFKYRGNLLRKIEGEKGFGKFLIAAGIFTILLSLFLSLFVGHFVLRSYLYPTSFEYLLAYFSIPLVLYGLYLKRDREVFLDSQRSLILSKQLEKTLKESNSELVINDLLTVELLAMLDNLYFKNQKDFLKDFSISLVNNIRVKDLIEKRLGLNVSELNTKITTALASVDCSFDNNYANLLISETRLIPNSFVTNVLPRKQTVQRV